ncbi:MAG: two-component regulator propeller domain-containing protein, partial [Acidobacteriota bacterium]
MGTLLASLGMLALHSLSAAGGEPIFKDPLRAFDHDAWGIHEGLSSDNIQALARSGDGYLWVGTNEGLFRFDGTHFRSLDELLKRSSPLINVRALAPSRSGGIWIASRDGALYSWRDERLTIHGKAGAFGSEIFSLCEGPDGSIWIGTRGAGLVRLRNGRRTSWTVADALSIKNVFAIREDGSGGLWIGARDGLFRWVAGGVRREELQDSGAIRRVFALSGDGRGGLWLAGLDGGLAHRDEKGRPRLVSDFRAGSIFALDAD